MNDRKAFGKKIVALLLLLGFLMPTAIEFSHSFENHEHIVCLDQASHLHEASFKCELCHIQLKTFNYIIPSYPDFIEINIYVGLEKQLPSPFFPISTITIKQLRAPPYFLS